MSPEDRVLLQKVLELSQENHAILKKMRRGALWGTAFRIFYWVLIIGISVGAYVYIQPYLDILTKQFSGLKGTLESLNQAAGQTSGLHELIKYTPR